MAVGEPPEHATPRVADPDEYNQTQRLQAINRARQRVESTIEESMVRLVTDPEFNEKDRQQVIRATLYSYLTNIEWLMVQSDERELLQSIELGTVTINPPEKFVRLVDDFGQGYPRVIDAGDLKPFTKTITGIQGYLTAEEIFEKTWTLQIEKRHSQPQALSEIKQTYMPVHISMNAFRLANRFLSEAGIDVDLKEEQHRAVVGEDVLKEVEEWRKQHIK